VNLPARIGVTLLITAAIWLVSTLVQRRIRQHAARAGIEWPATDVGMEVSPGLMRAIAITDLLHRIRFSLLGGVFVIIFLALGRSTEN
jgi:hypothetical protein